MKKIIGCCVGLWFLLWLVTPYQTNAEELNRTDAAITFEEAQIKDKEKLPHICTEIKRCVKPRGITLYR